MDKFCVIANTSKEPALRAARVISEYLESKGAVCTVLGEDERTANAAFRYTDAGCIPEDTQGVLVLGGDGTLLQASRDLHERALPLLGINLGTLGYLAEIEMAAVEEALDALLRDEYTLEKRMMLSGSVLRGEKAMLRDIALNDIVVGRTAPLRTIDFEVYVNKERLCSYRSDGIIMATPTGSTGYSLSAGGPLVSPEASLLLVTPIAPHTLNSRPLVLPDDVEITVELQRRGSGDVGAEVTFDGDTALRLEPYDRIVVQKSTKLTTLIKLHHTSFVEILRSKLG